MANFQDFLDWSGCGADEIGVIFHDIRAVAPSVERAIIINVATEVVSAVAIASTLRNADMPLLVLNCTPGGAGKLLMDELARQWNFDLLDLRLADHGDTLDRLFQEIHADRILLVDSDAEIKSPTVTAGMRQSLADPTAYGSGWLHHADWLTAMQSGIPSSAGNAPVVYRERPWIPCAMFRTSFVRAALAHGASFKESFVVGGAVMSLGLDPRFLERGMPLAVHNDTGADIHDWAKHNGFHFAGPSVSTLTDEVAHHHGVTRSVLAPGSPNGTQLSDIEAGALERLRAAYPAYWNGFAAAVQSAQVLA